MSKTDEPVRVLHLIDRVSNVPVCVVWEITLGCNLACSHCGSRAGTKRDSELTLDECKGVVDQLHEIGTREICLIGGEVFIRKDWVELVEYIALKDIECVIQTGGYKFPRAALIDAFGRGLKGIGISLDGFRKEHDTLRGKVGSYFAAIELLDWCQRNSYSVSVNTQISSLNKDYIEKLGIFLMKKGVKYWQLQLTVPMGNASDNFHLCIQPHELTGIFESLASIYDELRRGGMLMMPGNNVGYFGKFEYLWRGPERGGHYHGCVAGINGMGIEADGTIKACPSLPKERYSCGSVKTSSIAEAWHGGDMNDWNRNRENREFEGYCQECYYKDVCRGGCTWMSDSLFGKAGNNPYCIHRVEQLKNRNIMELIEKVQEASNVPFATGRYRIVQKECS